MLQNQLALTKGLEANKKAITQGLADMNKSLGIGDDEDDKDEQAQAPLPKKKSQIVKLDLEKNFDQNDIFTLKEFEFKRPNDFYDSNNEDLEEDFKDVNKVVKSLTGEINGRSKKQNPDEEYLAFTLLKEEQKETLMKYKKIMKDYFKSLEYQMGQGLYFSPQELLHRFELLAGSLAAGNNGVLPEYIQIAHRLRDHGIITNNQLNTLLRKVI